MTVEEDGRKSTRFQNTENTPREMLTAEDLMIENVCLQAQNTIKAKKNR